MKANSSNIIKLRLLAFVLALVCIFNCTLELKAQTPCETYPLQNENNLSTDPSRPELPDAGISYVVKLYSDCAYDVYNADIICENTAWATGRRADNYDDIDNNILGFIVDIKCNNTYGGRYQDVQIDLYDVDDELIGSTTLHFTQKSWVLQGGQIGCSSNSVPYNTDPGIISNVKPALGGICCKKYEYSWEQSRDEGSTWTPIKITGQEDKSIYDCPALQQTTSFRRKVTCGTESKYSQVLTINVTQSQEQLFNLSTSENYVLSISPQIPLFDYDDINIKTIANLGASVQYFDGLGRPKQTVSVASSPDYADIIQPIVYDEYGREKNKLLPYTLSNVNNLGQVQENPKMTERSKYETSAHYNFYNTDGDNIINDLYPYSEIVFEASPLNRVKAQGAPGVDWQPTFNPNGDPTFKGHTVKTDYLSNGTNDVRLFDIDAGGKLVKKSVFTKNTLFRTVIKDENWSDPNPDVFNQEELLHTTEEFKDKQGQVVLKRSYVEDGDDYGNDIDTVETYYVYDDFGLLRYVIPPEAVKQMYSSKKGGDSNITLIDSDETLDKELKGDQTFLYSEGSKIILEDGFSYTATEGNTLTISGGNVSDGLVYSYKYDARKRMVEKKIPGADPVYMVYDERDRLVATQDGEMRDKATNKKQWFFTKYDALNRPVMTGILESNIATQADMQKEVDKFYPRDALGNITGDMFETATGTIHGYTNNSFPNIADEHKYLTVTYYDDYDFATLWGPVYKFNQYTSIDVYEDKDGINNGYFDRVKGQVTGTLTKVLEKEDMEQNTTWMKTITFYDDRYRAIKTITDVYEGDGLGIASSSVEYDFVGKVMQTRTDINFKGDEKYVTERNEYDHAGRLLKTWHSYDGNDEQLLAENTYNELGELDVKQVDNSNQIMDYEYNIRGWLTGINNVKDAIGANSKKKFAMKLHYNDVNNLPGTPNAQFNGNISAMQWRTEAKDDVPGDISAYTYDYDALNRLTAANYAQGTSALNRNTAFDVSIGGYDLNGNINGITRKKNGTLIDNLDYKYTGNHLMSVSDLSNNELGFKEGSTNTYSYDLNGNMKRDNNRGLVNVEYNHLNLPSKLMGSDNKTISYIYDANGQKLAKLYDGNKNTDTYYAGSFIYEGSALKSVLNAEGMVNVAGNNHSYQYYLKDHLGNTRVMTSGTATNQIKWYYPFGMEALNYESSLENKYLYNGKELQDEQIGNGKLDWYDYGARFYDASLVRFHTLDPLSEDYDFQTPYAYAANNPILFQDYLGMGPVITNDGNGGASIDINIVLHGDVDEINKLMSKAFGDNFKPGESFSYSIGVDEGTTIQIAEGGSELSVTSVNVNVSVMDTDSAMDMKDADKGGESNYFAVDHESSSGGGNNDVNEDNDPNGEMSMVNSGVILGGAFRNSKHAKYVIGHEGWHSGNPMYDGKTGSHGGTGIGNGTSAGSLTMGNVDTNALSRGQRAYNVANRPGTISGYYKMRSKGVTKYLTGSPVSSKVLK